MKLTEKSCFKIIQEFEKHFGLKRELRITNEDYSDFVMLKLLNLEIECDGR